MPTTWSSPIIRAKSAPHARSLFVSADPGRDPICICLARATNGASMKNSARSCAPSTVSTAPASPSGRPMRNASASWAISMVGMGGITRCVRWAPPGSGNFSSPASGEGTHYKYEIKNIAWRHRLENRSVWLLSSRPRRRMPPLSGTTKKFNWTDEAWLKRAAASGTRCGRP